MSRSLRISNKQSRRSRHASSGKIEHRNSETSTRSSSTPSIPQSLADNGLEPFDETNILPDFGSPIWVDRVAMNLRPVSFHNDLANPSVHMNTMHVTLPGPTAEEVQDEDVYAGEVTYLQKTRDCSKETASFKKKRSKSADMWRDDSLEFSLSDLSQDHLTSTEEIIDPQESKRDFTDGKGHLQCSPTDCGDRANSLDELCSQKCPPARRQPHSRYAKWHDTNRVIREGEDDKMISPSEEDGNSYGAYTLPCRRSHCLSEGLSSHQAAMCASMQGRRAQTIQVRCTLCCSFKIPIWLKVSLKWINCFLSIEPTFFFTLVHSTHRKKINCIQERLGEVRNVLTPDESCCFLSERRLQRRE